MGATKKYKYYHSLPADKKPTYSNFMMFISQGYNEIEACDMALNNLKGQGSARKGLITENGRECARCATYKSWTEYHKNNSKIGHDCFCKVCRNEANKYGKRAKKIVINDMIENAVKYDENIFYSDPVIQNNLKILASIGELTKEKEDKMKKDYFVSLQKQLVEEN